MSVPTGRTYALLYSAWLAGGLSGCSGDGPKWDETFQLHCKDPANTILCRKENCNWGLSNSAGKYCALYLRGGSG